VGRIKIPEMPWYKPLEKWLLPMQPLVYLLGLAGIVFLAWALMQRDPVKRTAAVVYMWLP